MFTSAIRQADRLRVALAELATNALSGFPFPRRGYDASRPDPRRDLDAEYGYPADPDVALYRRLHRRDPYARRVIEAMPRECFQVQPTVYESERAKAVTPFEVRWDAVSRSLRGGQCWHAEEEGSAFWRYMLRADILSRIGRYGLALFGIDDGLPLSEPAEGVGEGGGTWRRDDPSFNAKARPARARPRRELLYVRCFDESLAEVIRSDEDESSPRFGQPVAYRVTFGDPAAGDGATTAREVHWTRVVHLAERLYTSEVYADPELECALDPVLDLKKVRGGSAEMYFQGAMPGMAIETPAELGGDVDVDEDALRNARENMRNGMQRDILLKGATIKSIAPQVSSPTEQVRAQERAICVYLNMPERIFVGSQIGDVAASTDDAAWNDRVRQRQVGYVTPGVIAPCVDRLIAMGVLPEPEQGYKVWWPDLDSQGAQEKARVALTKTQSLVAYSGGDPSKSMARMDYWTRIQGLTEEEAKAVIDAADEEAKKRAEEDAKRAAEAALLAPAPPPEPPPAKGQGGDPPSPSPPAPPLAEQAANAAAEFGLSPAEEAELRRALAANANPNGCNQHTGPGCGEGGKPARAAGFSGRVTDSAGRTRCYTGGRAVGCDTRKGDRQAAAAHARLERVLGSPQSATPDDLVRASRAMGLMTAAELKEAARAHGLVGAGAKRAAIDRILKQAQQVVTARVEAVREARKAGVPPRAVLSAAAAIRRAESEFTARVGSMLRDARDAYRAAEGVSLTRNHPAFRGGDAASVRSFDDIAYSLAGRYPDLLGDHGYGGDGASDRAAAKLFDYLSAGTPRPKGYRESCREAMELLRGGGWQAPPPGGAEEIPF